MMPYAFGDYILTFGEITYQSFGLDRKKQTAIATLNGVGLNLTTKRSLHEFRELPDGARAIAHNPRKRGDGVLA